jgi:hypothetical protein
MTAVLRLFTMKFLHFNIFAKSLGSNAIPWVMTVSLEWKLRIEAMTQVPYQLWVSENCTKEYLTHFHKNHASGHKVLMRRLWSQQITSAMDIPKELSGVSYVSENCVKYQVDQEEYQATTLPGLCTRSLPIIAQELYAHIMDLDQYFDWEIRGPCLYRTILATHPDVLSLCEYDIHDAIACYRGPLLRETFSEAMIASGYSGLLLNSPDPAAGSGLGMYWKCEEFELVEDRPSEDTSLQLPQTRPSTATIPIDTDLHGIVSNYDLHEHWHKLKSLPLLATDSSGENIFSQYEEMSRKDRHHVGLLRLRHKPTKKVLLVVATHLMTASRDCEGTNEYPGEVRLGEMETIGKKISSYLQKITEPPSPSSGEGVVDAIIYSGDFNLDIRQLDQLHRGIPSTLDSTRLRYFQTGFTKESNDRESPPTSGRSGGPYLKYHPDDKWNLCEAFESIHQWGVEGRVGYGQYCTSYNANRCEWIDMIWYSNQSLRLKNLSSMETPLTPIPNGVHASDHLPLCAEFEWK